METSFWLKHMGYRILLSKLEGIVSDCVENNGNPIRYPVSWPDGSRLRGQNTILKAEGYSFEEMAEGRYRFGANELFIYQALDKVLKYLAVSMKDPQKLYALVEDLESEARDLETRLVSELRLSVRASKCLESEGIATVGELCSHTAAELLEVRNFGETTLQEVRQKLGNFGLRLRGE
jgi:DNA-directed RNA polymerase subunit alpha